LLRASTDLVLDVEADGVEGQLRSGLDEVDGGADSNPVELDDVNGDDVFAEDDALRRRLVDAEDSSDQLGGSEGRGRDEADRVRSRDLGVTHQEFDGRILLLLRTADHLDLELGPNNQGDVPGLEGQRWEDLDRHRQGAVIDRVQIQHWNRTKLRKTCDH